MSGLARNICRGALPGLGLLLFILFHPGLSLAAAPGQDERIGTPGAGDGIYIGSDPETGDSVIRATPPPPQQQYDYPDNINVYPDVYWNGGYPPGPGPGPGPRPPYRPDHERRPGDGSWYRPPLSPATVMVSGGLGSFGGAWGGSFWPGSLGLGVGFGSCFGSAFGLWSALGPGCWTGANYGYRPNYHRPPGPHRERPHQGRGHDAWARSGPSDHRAVGPAASAARWHRPDQGPEQGFYPPYNTRPDSRPGISGQPSDRGSVRDLAVSGRSRSESGSGFWKRPEAGARPDESGPRSSAGYGPARSNQPDRSQVYAPGRDRPGWRSMAGDTPAYGQSRAAQPHRNNQPEVYRPVPNNRPTAGPGQAGAMSRPHSAGPKISGPAAAPGSSAGRTFDMRNGRGLNNFTNIGGGRP